MASNGSPGVRSDESTHSPGTLKCAPTGSKDQCGVYSAPSAIHFSNSTISCGFNSKPDFGGGMRSLRSLLWISAINSEASTSPGTMAA